MPRAAASLVLVFCLVPAAALACGGDPHDTQAWWAPPAAAQEATVADVVRWTKANEAVPVDANEQQVRTNEGIITGAVLLTSSAQYALSELPANKASRLVFYCANEKCGASHQAAQRALDAGYSNVAVMPVGIKGWKAAGQPTVKPRS
jgi:rhodanese-related sulfurtransferase